MGIAYSEPLFVIGYNVQKNELIVGTENELYKKEFLVKDINLLLFDEIKEPLDCEVKVRYSTNQNPCTITQIDESTIKVTMKEQIRAVTPGQSAVFYIDDIVVGGGKILWVILFVVEQIVS